MPGWQSYENDLPILLHKYHTQSNESIIYYCFVYNMCFAILKVTDWSNLVYICQSTTKPKLVSSFPISEQNHSLLGSGAKSSLCCFKSTNCYKFHGSMLRQQYRKQIHRDLWLSTVPTPCLPKAGVLWYSVFNSSWVDRSWEVKQMAARTPNLCTKA